MARGRMISKSLSTSEKYASLVETVPDLYEFCHSLYPLMVSHTDDFGRLQGDAFTVKHVCYPASMRGLQDFRRALQALHDAGLAVWYQVGTKWFIQVANFDPHQQGLHKRTRSQHPDPPGTSGNLPEPAGQADDDPTLPSEGKRRELKRTEEKKDASPEPEIGSEPTTTSPSVLEFPTVGSGGSVWSLSEAQVAEWASLYPSVSILAEAQKALAWIKASPGRRKTAGGMARFLVGWLNRANDSRPTTAPVRLRGEAPSRAWECPHVDHCGSSSICQRNLALGAERFPLRAAS